MSGMVGGAGRLARTVGAIALAVLAGSGVSIAAARAQVSVDSARQEDLADIRDRIRDFRDQLAELDKYGSGVDAELERLALELGLQQQLVSEATAEREQAETTLDAARERLEVVERELAATKDRLTRRIQALDRSAPANWLRGFATVRAPSDFFLYVRTLRFLARRDARLVPVYRAEEAELEAARRVLAERQEDLVGTISRQRRRVAELAEARRRQVLVAKALERERLRILREASTLDDKEQKLARMVAVLGSLDEPSLSGEPIQSFRGALDWPLAGEVATPFGPRYEARYGTSVPHNGIRLSPTGTGEVTAVFPGVVIFAAPFEGFGLTVVVHHPKQVFSLYAGLDELEVSKDDVVVLGQVLGRTGSALYFEMRVENRPEDPMEWLR
jgi:septal ring factor EnvC (AmiA/AmiB activator)